MILVDYREKKSGIIQILKDLHVECKETTLEDGDYVIVGPDGINVIIERKEASDYVSSLISGHLNNQLVRMSHRFPFSVVLVEGSITGALLAAGTTRQSVYSSLAGTFLKRSLTGTSGYISIIPTDSVWDTGLLLKYISQKLFSEDGLIRTPRLNPLKFSKQDAVICTLSTIPGIGPVLGESLLKAFHSIQNVANAKKEDLIKIPKIGEKKATKIFEFFRYKYIGE